MRFRAIDTPNALTFRRPSGRWVSWPTYFPLLLAHPGRFVRRFRWAMLLLVVGGLLDGWTTVINLAQFGVEVEVHPLQRWMALHLGIVPGLPLAKALQVVTAVVVAAAWKAWTGWLMGLCGLLYSLAAISNHLLWI
jgi:hypothetical protein